MTLRKFILRCGCFLLLFSLVSFWFFNFSPIDIPEYIPHTPIKINGLVLMIWTVTIFIVFEKRMLRAEPESTIWDLTSMAALSTLAAEIIFQLVRQLMIQDSAQNHLMEYLRSVLLMSFMSALVGFLIAFQLKTKKDGWLIIFIILTLIVLRLMEGFFFKS